MTQLVSAGRAAPEFFPDIKANRDQWLEDPMQLLLLRNSIYAKYGNIRYSSRRASIGWMRRPCRTGPIAAITPSVIINKTTSGSSIAR